MAKAKLEEFTEQLDKENNSVESTPRPKILKCRYCDQTAKYQVHIDMHERTHTGDRPYRCNACTYRSAQKGDLANHRTKTHAGPFSCEECPARFKREELLKKHRKDHSKAESLKCDSCIETKFYDVFAFEKHSAAHKENTGNAQEEQANLKCVYCNTVFEAEYMLEEHLLFKHFTMVQLVGTRKKHYKCPVCEIIFKRSWDEFCGHYRAHKGECPFTCSQCHKTFPCKAELQRHEKQLHIDNDSQTDQNPNPEKFICKHCGILLHDKETQKNHEKQHFGAGGNLQFKCKECSEEFKTGTDYAAHYMMHAEQRERYLVKKVPTSNIVKLEKIVNDVENKFACEICDYRTNNIKRLNVHLRAHKGEFSCSICCQNHSSNASLKRHMQYHNSEKGVEYKCKDCQEQFNDRMLYWLHRKTHKSARVYDCEFCGEKFTQRSTFVSHRRKHKNNPDELKFPCDSCPEKFANENMLQLHKLTHSGVLPFSCKGCSKQFATQKQLRYHRACNTNGFPCRHCGIVSFRRATHEKEHFDSMGNLHFKCSECKLDLKNGPDYAAHYMEHYKNIPHECSLCFRRYRSKLVLTNHISTAHKEQITGAEKSGKRKNSFNEKNPKRSRISDKNTDTDDSEFEETDAEETSDVDENEDNLLPNHHNDDLPNNIGTTNVKYEPSPVEKSELPLAVHLFRTKMESSNVATLVWLKRLEQDVVTVMKMNRERCVIFSQESKSNQKYQVKGMKKVSFAVDSLYGIKIKWTLYYSGCSEAANSLKDKQFNSYEEVETIIRNTKRTKDLINIVRHSDEGYLTDLTNQLRNNILMCNYKSE